MSSANWIRLGALVDVSVTEAVGVAVDDSVGMGVTVEEGVAVSVAVREGVAVGGVVPGSATAKTPNAEAYPQAVLASR